MRAIDGQNIAADVLCCQLQEWPLALTDHMVRFGIAGFGLHARKRLMPAFALATGARVTALSQRDMTRASASALEYGIPQAFDTVEDLCRSPEVDVVFVATPNICHLHDTLTALDCGKAVLCEKPMAMNADECRAMVDAGGRKGLLLGVAHIFRFANVVRTIRDHVQGGDIGTPLLARAEFSFPGLGHARTWIHDRAIGGGVVNDVGIHCLDSLRWILNEDPVEVQAIMTADATAGDAECAGVVNLRFGSGALVNLMDHMRAPYRTLLEITGSEGRIRCEHALALADPGPIELYRPERPVRSESVDNSDAFVRMIDNFADAVQGRGEFLVDAEEGWRNQRIMDAAYESAQSGRTVRLDW